MTRQASEMVFLDGIAEHLHACPLDPWLESTGIDVQTMHRIDSTNCYRGYIGFWEVFGDELFLVGLFDPDGQPLDARQVFAGRELPILADWFTGRLDVDRGNLLTYWHAGWGGQTEERICLWVDRGRVVRRRRYDHAKRLKKWFQNEFGTPEGYRRWLRAREASMPEPLGGFTGSGFALVGVDDPELLAGAWPDGLSREEMNELAGHYLAHLVRPGRPAAPPAAG